MASFGGEVADFDPKQHVRPRKSLKVMSRDIQLAVAAADMACADGRLRDQAVDPDRLGVVFGADMMTCELEDMVNVYRGCTVDGRFDFSRWGTVAMAEIFPLWMLKYLPNMLACHIGIAQDARGPNDSVVLGEVSSLAALSEAVGVIRRGQADVMIVGGGSSRLHPATLVPGGGPFLVASQRRSGGGLSPVRRPPRRHGLWRGSGGLAAGDPRPCRRPRRQGPRPHPCLCRRVRAPPARAAPPGPRHPPRHGRRAAPCGFVAADVGHVNAHGASTRHDDQIEAQAIRAVLGDTPVTAPKSCFGNLGAGSGAVEMVASVLACRNGLVPPTRNYQVPDPDCPIHVVHGRPLEVKQPTALVLNHTPHGQAMSVVLAGPEGGVR